MRAERAAIMAGGRSSRMGRPKAAVELAGRPLIAHPIAAARAAGLEPIVVAKPGSELPDLDCEVLAEPEEPTHPLTGIIAALEHLGAPVVVIACDLPLVPPALIAELASREGELVLPADPRPQPLIARYEPGLLRRLRSGLLMDEPLNRLAAELGAIVIPRSELQRFGDPEEIFSNVNDPAGLARIEALLGGQSGSSSTRAL
jgi:molybdopterin-guanine dinucleotide biosynthesis protein A